MINNKLNKFSFILLCLIFIVGCDNFLEENPTSQLSEVTFWNTEDDAIRAITACYRPNTWNGWWNDFDGRNIAGIKFEAWTDLLSNKELGSGYPIGGIEPTNSQISAMWSQNYIVIARTNYFLENIEKVTMDDNAKQSLIGEARFLRAYSYFWLSQLYGNIPLIDKTLTFDEANSVTQSPKSAIVDFAINDLNFAIEKLPVKRGSSEKGRVEKGTALALKGRFLMADKKWTEAATVYETLINLNRYVIDSRFKKLFEDEGDDSDEIIFARKYIENQQGEPFTQQACKPGWYGGYSQFSFMKNFIEMFPMTDGKSIKDSPLYDPKNPFDNRDPRLYATVLLPDYSSVNGKIYIGHPDSTGQTGPGLTGYGINKTWDHNFSGNVWAYGGDYILIRYPEVLLSYLECKIESGATITQDLLNKTINQLRKREEVNIGNVSETDPIKLREIVKNERGIELAMEGGIRYLDLIRWKEGVQKLNRKFYGMKITDNPGSYNGKYVLDSEGHIFIQERMFKEHNYLWPIPQSELDINDNLKQNPGYN